MVISLLAIGLLALITFGGQLLAKRSGRLPIVTTLGLERVGTSIPAEPTLGVNTFKGGSATVEADQVIPAFDHTFIVVEENHNAKQIIDSASAPYLNTLARQYGLATNYHAISSPSLPNYLALIGGSTFGISTDCTLCFINAPTLVDRVENSGRTWKAYMESMPSPCVVGDSGILYRQRHDPFVYFDSIRTNPARCKNVVPYQQLASDLTTAASTPNFVWITPNMCSDMHDCPVTVGDTWLKNNLPAILGSPAWTTQESLLVLTWDEGSGGSNQVPAIIIAPSAKASYTSSLRYDHYSLLRTIEQAWSLDPLTTNDAKASPMLDFWH